MSWLGRLLSRHNAEPEPEPISVLEADARRLAEAEAQRRGVLWHAPVTAEIIRGDAGPCWLVRSNRPGRGFGLDLTIDARTGALIHVNQRTRRTAPTPPVRTD
jgi:hypothetical protein